MYQGNRLLTHFFIDNFAEVNVLCAVFPYFSNQIQVKLTNFNRGAI